MMRREISFQKDLKRSIEATASQKKPERPPQLHECDPN